MNRLTTDTPNGNTENALNLFYIKDMETWVRGGGDAPNHPDVRLVEYIRDIARKHSLNISLDTSDEDLCEELFDILLDGTDTIEGIVTTLNTEAWAFAELREKLKEYEDTGLTPKECASFADSAKEDIDIVRIIEILSADAEGRLLVLPCKVGESVFTVQRSCISEYRITGFSIDGKSVFAKWELIDGFYGAFRIDGVPASRIGYDVFKSREEAESELKGAT